MATRTPTELRPLSASHALLARADGSAAFHAGTLTAYAGVTGPIDARLRDELIDRAALQVVVAPAVGLPGISARGFGKALAGCFEGALLLHLHPRAVLQLNVQLGAGPPAYVPSSGGALERDEADADANAKTVDSVVGPVRRARPQAPHPDSTFSAAQRAVVINAAMLAFLDAGVPMQATVAACACAYLPAAEARRLRKRRRRTVPEDAMDEETESGSVLVLDPTPEEEHYATSTHVFAFGFAGKAPPSHAGKVSHDTDDFAGSSGDDERDADEEEEVLYAESHGAVELAAYAEAVAQCRLAARAVVVPFYRRWLQQQHARQ